VSSALKTPGRSETIDVARTIYTQPRLYFGPDCKA